NLRRDVELLHGAAANRFEVAVLPDQLPDPRPGVVEPEINAGLEVQDDGLTIVDFEDHLIRYGQTQPSSHGVERSVRAFSFSSASRFGAERNHPAKAVFGFSPFTSTIRCSRLSATRKMMASPKPVLTISVTASESR